MENKSDNFKKSDRQIGNFIVSRYGNELEYIKISTSAGHWSETFRSDNEFYRLLDDLLKATDQKSEQYLHSLFISHMIGCNGVKDWQFIEDVYKAYNSMTERLNPAKEISEVDVQEMIKKEKEKYETYNEI